MNERSVSFVILGAVAAIAVAGLVLNFMNDSATAQVVYPDVAKVYGGAVKGVEFPNWQGRGVPRNVPGVEYAAGQSVYNDLHTSWNFYGDPKRNPIGDVPSAMKKCGSGGMLIAYSNGLPEYYASRGYEVVDTPDKSGVCVYSYPQTMLGGITQ